MVFVVPPKRKVINGMEWNGMVCPDATYHAASHVRLKRAPEAEKQEAVLRKNESGTMWSCGAVNLWSRFGWPRFLCVVYRFQTNDGNEYENDVRKWASLEGGAVISRL